MEFRGCPSAELAECIGQLHALQTAVHALVLQAVAAFDAQQGWAEDGSTSVVPWLVGTLNVSHRTAGQWATVAGRLEELPSIAKVYGEGGLSWDQLRPLVSFATPEADAELAEAAVGWSAAHTEAVARKARPIGDDETKAMHEKRSLRMWWGEDRMLRLRGRLPDAEGAAVMKAVERLADALPPDPQTGLFERYDARCADALAQLAGASLAADGDADRATVVVHADVALLAGGEGVAEVQDGPAVAAETARRLACDGRLQVVADGPDGRPVGVGRTTRTPPPWLRRLLRKRDGGCRFPSCDRSHWAHAHHVQFWGEGGPTDMGNLALLCSAHHRLVHEGGWRVEGDPDGELRFVRPDGHVLTTGPPRLRDDVRARVL